MKIPFLDLKLNYQSLQKEIDEAVAGVLATGHYILGPQVIALEKEIAEYCGTKFAIGVANGTDALILSLDGYGIGPGDEVITTPYSFFATCEAISRVGAIPVFVDIDEDTYNIDVKQIKDKLTRRTKAIIPVHLFGQPALMESIMEIAGQHQLIVIEDACQAIGATYHGRKTGSWGNAGCFSFFPTKNLGGFGDGGMITTNDEAFAERVKLLRAHGSRKKYFNEILGYNSRLDELQAAILRIKLKHLDSWNRARREKAEFYNSSLPELGLKTPGTVKNAVHVYHLYVVRHNARVEIMEALRERGIECGVYYPIPLHQQGAYRGQFFEALPVAEAVAGETFALPLFPEITKEQQVYVVAQLRQIMENLTKS